VQGCDHSVKNVFSNWPEKSTRSKTLVVDTADWLERLIWQRVCEQENKEAISDFGYGAGYEKSAAKFKGFLAACDHLRDTGMHIVVLAHCEIKRFENPEGDSYDRYVPKTP
jgi:hypothetical protein